MNKEQLHALWDRVERQIRDLLHELPSLSGETQDDVAHHLQHNELGLAFEVLCEALIQARQPISPAQGAAIAELDRQMGGIAVTQSVIDLVKS